MYNPYRSQIANRLADPNKDDTVQITPLSDVGVETDRCVKKVFIISVLLTLILSVAAILAGNPHKLSNPIDPDGRPCGEGDLKDYPYIYFATPSQKYLHRTVCVKKCEELSRQPEPGSSLECYPNSIVKSCQFHISKEDRDDEVLIYDSKLYLNKICMPLNIVYFKLIRDALEIDKMDQMLSDFKVTFPLILSFGVLAFCLSYLTKFLVDENKIINCAIAIFFIASTVGFLVLGVLFTYRAVNLLKIKPPSDKEVIASPENISDNVDQQNSSVLGNCLFALFCYINVILYIKQYIDYDQDKSDEGKQIVRMRNYMLSFISDVIKSQKLIYLPVATFTFFILMFGFFFYVEINVYSIGSTNNDERGLPFDQFKRNPITNILGIAIFIGFFWIFIFIIQACEYIVYTLAIIELNRRYGDGTLSNKQNEETSGSFMDKISKQIQIILDLRIGTIACCSILSFFFYHIRSFFEWIDTQYQHKIFEENQRNILKGQPNKEIPHSCFMTIQKIISNYYESSFLKSIQPYGFIYTIENQMPFSKAGREMQKSIDSTSYWFEDMLDGGEIFENQIKFSITFIISLCFLLVVQQFDKYEVSQILVPVFLMIIVSYIIALLYVNMYGSIYSTFIIFYLEKVYKEYSKQNQNVPNQTQLNNFEDFIKKIVDTGEDERPLAAKRNI